MSIDAFGPPAAGITLPVDDQAASGFLDIGTTRMQWGVANGTAVTPNAGAGDAVAFPQPFKSVPSVTISVGEVVGVQWTYAGAMHTVTANGFTQRVHRTDGIAGGAVEIRWHAIGEVP